VRGPKALCELQGYVYDAWLRMAEIYDELDNKRRANALRKKAAVLFRNSTRFSGTRRPASTHPLWTEDKKKVLSVASNVGQMPMVRHHRSGTRSDRGEAIAAQRHVERLGYSARFHPITLIQPIQLSDRGGVAA